MLICVIFKDKFGRYFLLKLGEFHTDVKTNSSPRRFRKLIRYSRVKWNFASESAFPSTCLNEFYPKILGLKESNWRFVGAGVNSKNQHQHEASNHSRLRISI
jgi:hypothetical protein